ncbi:MAG: ADP-ribosyl-(dinitrogen reductase) glycohydrolase [Lentisphaerae bacterium ADurb.BinA184]|nr:MAG: ADP-ribosyl-(dinitrogen reductase) glycohydrolase [Lentisphaerae bacterium ADurb.BinA184]
MNARERFRGCLLGLACGDAVGTTVEFKPRGTFRPVTDMEGGGPFGLQPGEWTDDTSMALCLATSLVETGRFDPTDQMRRYCRWHDEGYLSSNGRCFDIGSTTSRALHRFWKTGDAFSGEASPTSAGNGCLMRLAPVPMFFFPDEDTAVRRAGESAQTTHGAEECIQACRLFARLLCRALGGADKEALLTVESGQTPVRPGLSPRLGQIAAGTYRHKTDTEIRGTGYVVDCLEAALWCFHGTDSFRDAILAAANLGDDADTTAAVCGQIAGAHYGENGIPAAWRKRLVQADKIAGLADSLLAASTRAAKTS